MHTMHSAILYESRCFISLYVNKNIDIFGNELEWELGFIPHKSRRENDFRFFFVLVGFNLILYAILLMGLLNCFMIMLGMYLTFCVI